MSKINNLVETLKPVITKIDKATRKGDDCCSILIYSKDGFQSKVGLINVDDCPMRKDYKDITRTFVAVNFAVYHFFKHYNYTVETADVQGNETLEETILRKARNPFKAMEWTIRW